MIRQFLFASLLLGCLGAVSFAIGPASDWKGVKVMPKLGAVVKVGAAVIDSSQFNLPWTVQDSKGDWLYVGDVRKGWTQRSQVVTLDEAPAYFTGLIQRQDNTAWAYHGRAIAAQEKGDYKSAIADLGEEVRLLPNAVAHNARGNVLFDHKEFDKALADYNEAIRLSLNDPQGYNNRGTVLDAKQEFDKALAEYERAIRLDPKDPLTFCNRAATWMHKHEFEKAIADYTIALRLDPNDPYSYSSAAWLRATCPDARFRNGEKAVALATKACELSGWTSAETLESLAAGHAESGDFDAAINYQTKAIELKMRDIDFAAKAMPRLKLYKEHQPFREE